MTSSEAEHSSRAETLTSQQGELPLPLTRAASSPQLGLERILVGAPTFFRRKMPQKLALLASSKTLVFEEVIPQIFLSPVIRRAEHREGFALSIDLEVSLASVANNASPHAPGQSYFSSPANSAKSAMVVNSRNNSASNAKRLLRTASSSAMTITSIKN